MIERRFIDWSVPALPAVVRALVDERTQSGFTDLSDTVVVTPGARAGRRFLELLAEITGGRNAPPRVITPGLLPELFYEPKRPFADDLTQELAWVDALRGVPSETIRKIVASPPRFDDIESWLKLAKMLAKVHRELAADRLGFADVAVSPRIPPGRETARWGALRDIQAAYLAKLDDLQLWDKQTARRFAVDYEECTTDLRIVLIGTVDMNSTLRGMLDQVADRVLTYVHAPEELADRFDEHGVLRPDAWQNAEIDLPDSVLRFVDGPADQAAAVVDAVAALDGSRRADELVVGVADESLASPVRAALDERGVATRWIGHRTLKDSLPYRLLVAMADWLEDERTENTLTLIRHPDVSHWLNRQKLPPDWLEKIDKEVAERAPRYLGRGRASEKTTSRLVADLIERWLGPFKSVTKPLGDWAIDVTASLRVIYDGESLDPNEESDREARASLTTLTSLIAAQASVPDELSFTTTAAVSIRFALEAAGNDPSPPTADPSAVEMLGWLELPLDDAPVMIVAGFNEGSVPSSLNQDMFLPNGLREALGLEDNKRRYARDAYATCVLRHSRSALTLTIGRRTSSGDPLLPSRLLFATQPEAVAKRVLSLLEPVPEGPLERVRIAPSPKLGFRVPKPSRRLPEPLRLRATAFADYIACPYRFYLRHIEKLECVDGAASELDPLCFGSLIHEVLRRWGDGPLKNARNADDLKSHLSATLDQVIAETLDEAPLPAVRLQIEQARLRLAGFASWQAGWAAEGWRVEHVEKSGLYEIPIDAKRTVTVSGRIDRIDYHADNEQWAIFDYKTGEAGESPQSTHVYKKQWIDLQLPLYARMATQFGVTGQPQLGYIVLPKAVGSAGSQFAKWSAEDLAAADDVAKKVARRIADGEFWPPERDVDRMNEFDAICLEGVLGREETFE